MIHTASLLHDDILDHAHTRRGKPSVNSNWDARKSTFAGNRAMIIISSGNESMFCFKLEKFMVGCRGLHPGSWIKANGWNWKCRGHRGFEPGAPRNELVLSKCFNSTISGTGRLGSRWIPAAWDQRRWRTGEPVRELPIVQLNFFQERFEHYLTKSFNKTASLMAHSCQANGKNF